MVKYVWSMRVLGVIYALGAISFFFFPDEVFYLLNNGPNVFKLGLVIPPSVEHFWLVLASSMMAMLAALSFLAAESPRIKGYALVHVLSKTVSTAGFIYSYLHHQHYFAYAVGALVDGSLAIFVTWRTLRISA